MGTFKSLIIILNIPRLLPLIILFLIFFDKCAEDVQVAVIHRKQNSENIRTKEKILWFCYLIIFDKYFRNIFYHRIGYWKYTIQFLAPQSQSFIIGTYTKIGEGLLGVHPFSTVLNARKIGKNFIVKNDVTVGNNNGGLPTIGDNVSINVNSVIVGGIIIGNNVTIGACSLIMHNVPDNCIVAGNPAIIISKDGNKCKIPLKEYNCKYESMHSDSLNR